MGIVIAPQDGQETPGTQPLDALRRLGTIAHDIAEAEKFADALALDFCQHGLQRR